jgi:flagellin-like protein
MGRWIRATIRFARNKRAVTGLETAIMMIAFVIVDAAFAYTVLNMGFLATQKSQEVAMGGMQAASAAIVLDGPVYGYSTQSGSDANVTIIIFWLKTASRADSIDLNVNKTTIGFQNPRGVWPNIYSAGGGDLTYSTDGVTYKTKADACTVSWEVGSGMLLDRDEKIRVTIDLTKLEANDAPVAKL